MRPFRENDRVFETDTNRHGTVLRVYKRDLEVRFDDQDRQTHTVLRKHLVELSQHPLDRLVNGV